MVKITEDYCSYEIAKLLKEKGFDEDCDNYYDQSSNEPQQFTLDEIYYSYDEFIKAPTLQMAMKWLREVHKLHIGITRGPKGYHITIETIPFGVVKYITKEIIGINYVNSYEEACEAAIKYCLENLI